MFLGSLLVSCTHNDEIKISGIVRNMQGKQIVYFQSVDGMFNSLSYDTLKVNTDGTFLLTLPAEEFKRVRFLQYGKGELGSVIVTEPDIEIMLDGAAEEHFKVKGLGEREKKVCVLLDKLNKDVWDLRARRGDRWNIAKDTVVASVVAKLKADALAMEEEMKGIDEAFYAKAQQDVRMQLMLAFQNQLFGMNWQCAEPTKRQWMEEWEKMKQFWPENHPEAPSSLAFYDVVSNNAAATYFVKGESVPEGFNKDPNELSFYYFEHQLTGKPQEAAMAQLFLQDEDREENAPVIIPLSERFKKLYPQSPWMPLVDRAVAKNKAFNETKIPDYIHFPNVEKAKTFKDVTDLYKGKVIFMDIWATWCGPCRNSFAHVRPLQEYARQHDDVVLLYLSLDRSGDDIKWRKMAAHYDLTGEHVRVQEAFLSEIYKIFGDKRGALSIPRCVIFDKNGDIRFSVAASPEDMEKLKGQLEDVRNMK